MLTVVQMLTFVLGLALVGACAWGFVRSKSVGFILLLIGFILGSLNGFVSLWLFTITGDTFGNMPTEDRHSLLFAIPAVFTASLVLAGVIVLAMGWPRATTSVQAPAEAEADGGWGGRESS